MKTNTKIMVASLSLMASMQAMADIGGLNVQSNLGEPFSGSIIVTDSEAAALIKSGSVNVSGSANISGTVVAQGNDRALIRLHSTSAIQDPIVSIIIKAGNQTRQYTAMINPSDYRVQPHTNVRPSQITRNTAKSHRRSKKIAESVTQTTAPTPERDFVQHQQPQAAVVETTSVTDNAAEIASATHKTTRTRYHHVHHGETLSSIAARFRPHNMSVQRAMRALVAANPRAFRNGNPNSMYRNVTLYIPTASQFHAYAAKAARRLAHSRMAHAPIADATQQNNVPMRTVAPAETATPQATLPTENKVEHKTTSQLETAKMASPVAENKSEPTKEAVPASKPEPQTEEAKPAEKSVEASKPMETKETPASAPVAASTAVSVSEIASASTAAIPAASEPAASIPAPEPKPAAEPAPVAEEETDWLTMGLGGAAVVAALGGLVYAKRRKQNSSEDDSDENTHDVDVYTENIASTASETAERFNWGNNSASTAPIPTAKPTFNDTDDNLFGSDESVEASQSAPSKAEFDLETFDPTPEAFTLSAAVESNEEWAWTGDDVVTTSTVEADAKPEMEWVAETVEINEPVAKEVKTNDDWLNDFVTEKPVAPASEPTQPTDDDWLNDFVAEKPVAPAVEPTQPAAVDFDFNLPSEETTPVTTDLSLDMPQTLATDLDLTVPTADLDLNLNPPEIAAPDLDLSPPVVETPAISLDTPDVAIPDLDLSPPETETPAVPSFDLETAAIDAPQAEISADELASLDSLSMLTDDMGLDSPIPMTTPEVVPEQPAVVANTDDLMDWNELPETPQNADFVSEAVGMAAPLEAKLELAKMYLEIDDAVAARETLRELIIESTGNVQNQAKELLAELGG